MGLGMSVRINRARELTGDGVDIIMTLCRAGDTVRPIETGVEPLRRIRGRDLLEQHVRALIVERFGVLGRVEIAVLFTPPTPAPGEAMHDLLHAVFRTENRAAIGADNGLTMRVD